MINDPQNGKTENVFQISTNGKECSNHTTITYFPPHIASNAQDFNTKDHSIQNKKYQIFKLDLEKEEALEIILLECTK